MKNIWRVLLLISAISFGSINWLAVSAQEEFSVVLISEDPDTPGANFIFDGWTGLVAFGRDNILPEGEEGYHFLPVYAEEDYEMHFTAAVESDYDLIIGLGVLAEDYINKFAEAYTEQKFLLMDGDVALPNVISVVFKDFEAAFLAGVAAGLETESDHIGFVGGVDNETINAFEQGFIAGVAEVNADAVVESVYLDWFDDVEGAEEAARSLIDKDIDVIFHAAGQAGMGVFEAGKNNLIENGRQIWVIGVDADQTEAGEFRHDDHDYSITLTSTMKKTGNVLREITQQAYDGEFEAGIYEYGMFEGAIDIAAGNLTGETFDIVGDYRSRMQAGELDVTSLLKTGSQEIGGSE